MTIKKGIQEEFETLVSQVKGGELTFATLTPELGARIHRVWHHPRISQLYRKRRDELDLYDSAPHFLGRVALISAPNYRPSELDILHSRIPTTGATQIQFPYKTVRLLMVDVGGNRSEMKKWAHFFDDVDALIFIAAIQEYDQTSHEYSAPINKLELSKDVFSRICSVDVFRQTAFLLFLNKIDLFEEKITRRPFRKSYTEYTGQNDSTEVKEYVKGLFRVVAEKHGHADKFYCHYTNATDTDMVDKVFNICMEVIIEENMKGTGFT